MSRMKCLQDGWDGLYLVQSRAGNSFKYDKNNRGKPCLQHCWASLEYWSVSVEGKYWDVEMMTWKGEMLTGWRMRYM